jgi:hypothetical protein
VWSLCPQPIARSDDDRGSGPTSTARWRILDARRRPRRRRRLRPRASRSRADDRPQGNRPDTGGARPPPIARHRHRVGTDALGLQETARAVGSAVCLSLAGRPLPARFHRACRRRARSQPTVFGEAVDAGPLSWGEACHAQYLYELWRPDDEPSQPPFGISGV